MSYFKGHIWARVDSPRGSRLTQTSQALGHCSMRMRPISHSSGVTVLALSSPPSRSLSIAGDSHSYWALLTGSTASRPGCPPILACTQRLRRYRYPEIEQLALSKARQGGQETRHRRPQRATQRMCKTRASGVCCAARLVHLHTSCRAMLCLLHTAKQPVQFLNNG